MRIEIENIGKIRRADVDLSTVAVLAGENNSGKSTVGKVLEVTEDKMDVAAALAGSGPAYYFLVTEALIDAGVNLGLTREQASELANSTAAGAGQLLVESEQNASSLRYGVSSPGGTTVAALRELEESGIRGAFYRAIDKCVERTRSMN